MRRRKLINLILGLFAVPWLRGRSRRVNRLQNLFGYQPIAGVRQVNGVRRENTRRRVLSVVPLEVIETCFA